MEEIVVRTPEIPRYAMVEHEIYTKRCAPYLNIFKRLNHVKPESSRGLLYVPYMEHLGSENVSCHTMTTIDQNMEKDVMRKDVSKHLKKAWERMCNEKRGCLTQRMVWKYGLKKSIKIMRTFWHLGSTTNLTCKRMA